MAEMEPNSSVPLISSTYESISQGHPVVKQKYWEDYASFIVYLVPSAIILIVGTIGNILSFLVFNKKSMKQSVTSVYFRMLAISDTMVLYSGAGVGVVLTTSGVDLRTVSHSTCKFFVALVKTLCYHSCWTLVLISIDRFIGIYFPHKYRQLCTKRRAVIALIILVFIMASFVGGFWGSALMVTNDVCGVGMHHLPFFNDVYQWLDLCVLNLLPTVILVSINISIIYKISHSEFGSKEDSNSTNTTAKKQSYSLTLILLSISFVYILCTIPTSTAFLAIKTFHGPRKASQILLYIRCCETLYAANHASNFFLYCVHGTTFRRELKGLFCKTERPTSSASNSTNVSAYTVSQADRTEKPSANP